MNPPTNPPMIELTEVARTLVLLPLTSKQTPANADTAREWAKTATRSVPSTASPQPSALGNKTVKAKYTAIAASDPHTPEMDNHWRYLIIGLQEN